MELHLLLEYTFIFDISLLVVESNSLDYSGRQVNGTVAINLVGMVILLLQRIIFCKNETRRVETSKKTWTKVTNSPERQA
jgi:hypothetical protein